MLYAVSTKNVPLPDQIISHQFMHQATLAQVQLDVLDLQRVRLPVPRQLTRALRDAVNEVVRQFEEDLRARRSAIRLEISIMDNAPPPHRRRAARAGQSAPPAPEFSFS